MSTLMPLHPYFKIDTTETEETFLKSKLMKKFTSSPTLALRP